MVAIKIISIGKPICMLKIKKVPKSTNKFRANLMLKSLKIKIVGLTPFVSPPMPKKNRTTML
jgi:hypothetical protein